MRKRFDRTIEGEGRLIKREKADRERGISRSNENIVDETMVVDFYLYLPGCESLL